MSVLPKSAHYLGVNCIHVLASQGLDESYARTTDCLCSGKQSFSRLAENTDKCPALEHPGGGVPAGSFTVFLSSQHRVTKPVPERGRAGSGKIRELQDASEIEYREEGDLGSASHLKACAMSPFDPKLYTTEEELVSRLGSNKSWLIVRCP